MFTNTTVIEWLKRETGRRMKRTMLNSRPKLQLRGAKEDFWKPWVYDEAESNTGDTEESAEAEIISAEVTQVSKVKTGVKQPVQIAGAQMPATSEALGRPGDHSTYGRRIGRILEQCHWGDRMA